MNNADLADKLAADNGMTKADARKLVDGVFAAIADAASKGEGSEQVQIHLNGGEHVAGGTRVLGARAER